MNLNDFDYALPESLIAQTPVEPRNASRLMVLNPAAQSIEHAHFRDLARWLLPGDTLVLNDTRVMPARLIGHREPSGGRVEVFLLRRISADTWEVLVKPGRRLRLGAAVKFSDELSCSVVDTTDFGGRLVRFAFHGIFEEILDRLGETPLPPYIHEELADRERYQTVYNRELGSAAAPTAGLHFTAAQLDGLRAQGVNTAFVTLHVGLGTFRPVTEPRIEDHPMHREHFSISAETAALVNATRRSGHRVIAVGTTSVRTLEAAAGPDGTLAPTSAWTEIFIYPGYRWKIVDALVTNFHLPKSTLIMLVSAFAGREFTLAAYAEAVRERYRFFSFGDAMLITGRQA